MHRLSLNLKKTPNKLKRGSRNVCVIEMFEQKSILRWCKYLFVFQAICHKNDVHLPVI